MQLETTIFDPATFNTVFSRKEMDWLLWQVRLIAMRMNTRITMRPCEILECGVKAAEKIKAGNKFKHWSGKNFIGVNFRLKKQTSASPECFDYTRSSSAIIIVPFFDEMLFEEHVVSYQDVGDEIGAVLHRDICAIEQNLFGSVQLHRTDL